MVTLDASTSHSEGTNGRTQRGPAPPPAPAEATEVPVPATPPPDHDAGQRQGINWPAVFRGFSGFAIWLLLVGAIAYPLFRGRVVEILLDVSRDLVASGRVLYDGQPVANGVVHLAVDEPRSQRRVASAVVEVKDGSFSVPLYLPARKSETDQSALPFKVTAKYFGRLQGAEASRRLQAEAVVYVNSDPPLGPSAWWATGVATGAIFILISVFTSRVGVRRIRLLFVVMYLITFLSLVLPIVITMLVARNPFLVEMMKEAPIGLVKAKASGLRDTQWLINIGGTVVSAEAGKLAGAEPATTSGAAAIASPSASPDTSTAASDGGLRVSGGIAVPFYLVLLAMFGAAVNLTRRVPAIQTKAEALNLGRELGFFETSHYFVFGQSEVPTKTEQCATWAGIREDLVQNYMYVLSAPVLAIAVYYILQIVANEVSQPILVLGSFAAGLASESIVKYVMEFADKKIKYA
jgi:hypothetical protein